MNTDQLMLIDISGLAHQIFHVSGNEPDPSYISNQLVSRVRAIASQHPHTAICCDNGKSFRHDIDPNYKAGRDLENRAVIKHQLNVALDRLRKEDGFPVWSSGGYEADDLVASATAEALKIDPDVSVIIVSDDKDMTQLISDRVTMRKFDGTLRTPEDVRAKFGVPPSQMTDFLALCGDKSDNIIGAKGIANVNAAKLLTEHGSLAALYEKMAAGVVPGVTPAMRTNLMEFKSRWPVVAQLIALKTDVPIPFAEIAVERTAAPMTEMEGFIEEDAPVEDAQLPTEADGATGAKASDDALKAAVQELTARTALETNKATEKGNTSGGHPPIDLKAASREAMQRLEPIPAPVEFRQQLEPRTLEDAKVVANIAFASKALGAYGTPQAILLTIMRGRELGMGAMASLHGFHHIDGKPTMSAATISSLVLKSKLATYFRCSERTAERCTFVTKRGDDPEFALTYTIEEAKAAWSKDEASWKKSGWGKHPADMLVARASSKLARLVYPDVVSGLYAPEEME